MKRTILILAITLAISNIFAQSNWNWMYNAGGTGDDQALAVTSDASGNVYVTGYFTGTVNFGGTNSLTSSGDKDMFLLKLNSSGVIQWAKKGGGSLSDKAIDVKCDASGNIYTLGWHEGSATFGTTTLDNSNGAKTFVVKWNNAGTVMSTMNLGGYGKSFVIDSGSNIYLASVYSSTIKVITTSLTSHGFDDIYLTKITSTGSESWVKTIWSTAGYETPIAITLTPGDSLLVTGRFGSILTFEGSTTQCANNGGAASEDLFLAKYSNSGTFVWVKQFDATMSNNDAPNSLKVDVAGNILIAGTFTATVNFYSYMHTSVGGSDLFVTKLASNGSSAFWSKKEGGLSSDGAISIGSDNSSNVYINGFYSDTLTFENIFMPNTGNSNIYLAKYNASGDFQWVKDAGGNGEDGSFGLSVASDGSALVCGKFSTTAKFHGQYYTSNGGIDLFVSKSASTYTPRAMALFTASAVSVMAGSQITFTDQSLGDPNHWSWSFVGGTPDTSNSQNPVVTYNTAGTYKVTLSVSNSYGESSQLVKNAYITVTPFVSPCNAVSFDGVDDYIDCGSRSSLRFNYNFTIEAWIKPTAEGGYPFSYLNKTTTSVCGYGLGYLNGKLRFVIHPTNQFLAAVDSMPGVTVPLNEWSHVACTYDGKIAKIYVNGVLGDSKTISTSNTSLNWGTNPVAVYIGRYSNGTTSEYFKGIVDDVRLWKVARTETEINTYLNYKLVGTEANLSAYWNLNDGSGLTANESTINNYDGTLKNGAAWVNSQNACWGLSVEENVNNSQISIYPNPANRLINVKINSNNPIYVTIFDFTGKKIQTTELIDNQGSISISHLSSGVYFVEIFDGKNKEIKKLFKQ